MTNSDFQVDGPTFSSLEREAPLLMRVKQFADALDQTSWFAHLGERASDDVRHISETYLDRLGFPDAELAILPTWEDAADAAETYDWASAAWEAEELARADLTARALAVMSEEALDIGLRLVAQEAGQGAKAAMEDQASLWDMVEEGPRQLAVGAAVQAAHGAALSLIVAASSEDEEEVKDHAFMWKFRLFAEGRWPVAIVGSTFSLF
ncbi:MAG: hypothetical protein AAF723_05655 [Pseudomonadota bacterium]